MEDKGVFSKGYDSANRPKKLNIFSFAAISKTYFEKLILIKRKSTYCPSKDSSSKDSFIAS